MDQLQSGNRDVLHEARYMRRETTWQMSRATWFSYKQVAETCCVLHTHGGMIHKNKI